jgi:hypothetical protein
LITYSKKSRLGVLTPYFEDNSLKEHFEYPLKYTTKNYRKTFDLLVENCQNLIASDFDYKIPGRMGYSVHSKSS